MGSFFSSSKSKYDSDIQIQTKITQQVNRNRAQSAQNSRSAMGQEKQTQTKTSLMSTINEQLGQSKNHPNYVLDASNEPHNNYHRNVLEGMASLIYLKQRKKSSTTDKFLAKFGFKLQSYIADFSRMYPQEKVIIENLKRKFKAIYGVAYTKFNGTIY